MIKATQIGELIPSHILEALSQENVNSIVANIADGAREHWVNLASQKDSSFQFDYIQGIQPPTFVNGMAIISLIGEVPHMLEDGDSEKDMRDFLLGPNVPVANNPGDKGKKKSADDGFYRSIPIRHKTPGSGSTLGQPMGDAYKNHSEVPDAAQLGRDIYKAAKALNPYKGSEGSESQENVYLPAGLAPKLAPHHSTDIYAGMVREEFQSSPEKKPTSQYVTFRTISTNVKEGWMRKAITAWNLADEVSRYVEEVAPKAFEAFMKELSG